MEVLKKLLLTFVLILTGILISTSIFISIFVKGYVFEIILLWQIIGMSAVCAIGNLIFLSRREISKRKMRVRLIVHYCYINLVVLSGAYLFQWVNWERFTQPVEIMLSIAAVYIVIKIFDIQSGNRTAEIMNKRLSNLNNKEKDGSDRA